MSEENKPTIISLEGNLNVVETLYAPSLICRRNADNKGVPFPPPEDQNNFNAQLFRHPCKIPLKDLIQIHSQGFYGLEGDIPVDGKSQIFRITPEEDKRLNVVIDSKKFKENRAIALAGILFTVALAIISIVFFN